MNSSIAMGHLRTTHRLWIAVLVVSFLPFAAIISVQGQQAQNTENKADNRLRSSSRVNPSTLAMEFSLPLGNYPGRAGNSVPVSLSYSSKSWEAKLNNYFNDR